jgi:hypothetical protein
MSITKHYPLNFTVLALLDKAIAEMCEMDHDSDTKFIHRALIAQREALACVCKRREDIATVALEYQSLQEIKAIVDRISVMNDPAGNFNEWCTLDDITRQYLDKLQGQVMK